ncbi:MAG: hypothetical protein ACJ8CR_09760 [Roseiflexaceae bacterium]
MLVMVAAIGYAVGQIKSGTLAPLASATIAALDRVLPAHWSHATPIDNRGATLCPASTPL